MEINTKHLSKCSKAPIIQCQLTFPFSFHPKAPPPLAWDPTTKDHGPFSRHPSPSFLWAAGMQSPGPGHLSFCSLMYKPQLKGQLLQKALPNLQIRRALSGLLWHSACPLKNIICPFYHMS